MSTENHSAPTSLADLAARSNESVETTPEPEIQDATVAVAEPDVKPAVVVESDEKPVSEATVESSPAPEEAAPEDDVASFRNLGLIPQVQRAVEDSGYVTPTPIQAETIPPLLDGRDLIGQAQTGTGKTAAFALPILSRLSVGDRTTQVLVLAPTRELAIQVAEAFQEYARFVKGVSVIPVYGGQDYNIQLRELRRGPQVVVGTPGRVMDHIRRGTLKLDGLECLVLDEADEMLRMGFIDDVEWVLDQTPAGRQIAVFSATMPPAIRRIAQKHLSDPVEITIKEKTATALTIRQRYTVVPYRQKADTLVRLLETEDVDGMIVFVRTRSTTVEVADHLQNLGHKAVALNGDIPQKQRERTIDNLKSGRINIVVATDVAARGLDVQRISHVINFDFPHDTEAYIHRIGRTGRAGREGDAILFVTPKERYQLRNLERGTDSPIEHLKEPTTREINIARAEKFKQRITDALATPPKADDPFASLITQYLESTEADPKEVAVVLARLLQGDSPLFVKDQPKRRDDRSRDDRGGRDNRRQDRNGRNDRDSHRSRRDEGNRDRSNNRDRHEKREKRTDENMECFRIEVGHNQGVRPGNIVGAIANEAGLDSKYIGRINILDHHSEIDLPAGMPEEVFEMLQTVYVSGKPMKISRVGAGGRSEQSNRSSGGHRSGGNGSRPGRGNRSQGRPGGNHSGSNDSGGSRAPRSAPKRKPKSRRAD